MRKQFSMLWLVAIALIPFSGSAFAYSVTYSDQTSFQSAVPQGMLNWATPYILNIQKFDASLLAVNGNLAQLTSVTLNVTGYVQTSVTVSNPNVNGDTIIDTLTVGSKMQVQTTAVGGTVLVIDKPLYDYASAAGGTIDLAPKGSAGDTFSSSGDQASLVASKSYNTTQQSYLDIFTGTGSVPLYLAATVTQSEGGSGSVTMSQGGYAWGILDVTYNYIDSGNPVPSSSVPEPGTIMLLGSGLLMYGGSATARFRRKMKPSTI